MAFDNPFGSTRSKKGLKFNPALYRNTDDETGSKSNRNPDATAFRETIAKAEQSDTAKGASQSASAGVPQEKLPDYYITDKDGNKTINPRYKSGRGGSVLSAIRQNQGLRTGNQFNDAGVMIGSAIGGLFNKDLRGQEQYEVDTAAVNERNKQALVMTEASQRLQMQAEQMAKMAEARKIAADKDARAAATAEITDRGKMAKQLENNINSTSGEERRKYQLDHARLFNLPNLEEIDDDYMVGWKNVNLGGDVNYQQDGNGRVREATYMGQSISKLTIEDQMKIAILQNKLNPANVLDAEKAKSAFDIADKVLEGRKGEFKTAKGLFNPVQYNAQRMQLVNKIIATSGANPDLQTTKVELNINGVPTMVDVPLLSNTPSGTPTTGGSQFMPVEEGGVIKVPVPSGVGNNEAAVVQKDTSFTDPKTVSTPADFTNEDVEAEIQKAASNPALNKALGSLSEGGTFKASKTIKGKKRIVTFTKKDGKIVITDVQ